MRPKHLRTSYKLEIFSLLMCMGMLISACDELSSTQVADTHTSEEIPWVDTMKVRKDVFEKELLSNGKLSPLQQATLSFRINKPIRSISVRNGQRIKKGQILAVLESFEEENAVEQSQNLVEKARIAMQDALIGSGYTLSDSVDIPDQIYQVAQTRSGLLEAQANLKKAQHQLSLTKLRAPFSGLIANLEAQAFNTAQTNQPFCTLINDRQFEVGFQVLESEIERIKAGQAVRITPFSLPNQQYQGKISQINPIVDENGMIQVKALIENGDRKLMAGMNVHITIKQLIPAQLIVPKTTIVPRQGRSVIFTWENDSAIWNYVEPMLENSEWISISTGLTEEDIVIISGNLNLAHKAPVKISPKP